MAAVTLNNRSIDPDWKPLFRVAGAAAFVVALFIPVQLTVFFFWPPPSTIIGWFTLFHDHWLIGLLDMDLLLILDTVLFIPIFLGLYFTLRKTSPSAVTLAFALGFIGTASYCASMGAFNMLSLSQLYAAAATEADKAVFLAAGQATMTNWMGTAFDVGYILQGISLSIFSVVMLRSAFFGRAFTYLGLVMSATMLLPPTAGTIGIALSIGSVFPLEIWCVLLGLRFLQLGGKSGK